MKSNKYWIAILGGLLLVSVVAALLLRQTPVTRVAIWQDGEMIQSLDLTAVTKPYTMTVERGDGFNVIGVEQGRICVLEANCPDSYCVGQGWLESGSAPIVCLPHRLVIRVEGGSPPELDAIVG